MCVSINWAESTQQRPLFKSAKVDENLMLHLFHGTSAPKQTTIQPCSPDLAIEVVAPSDTVYDVQEKVFEYLDAGTKIVWIMDPASKTVTVYRSRNDIKIRTSNQTLTGEDVVEGFSCSVAEILSESVITVRRSEIVHFLSRICCQPRSPVGTLALMIGKLRQTCSYCLRPNT